MTMELDRKARAFANAAKELIDKGTDENQITFEENKEAIGKSVKAYCEGIGYSDKYNF